MKRDNKDLMPAGEAGNSKLSVANGNLRFRVDGRGPAKLRNKQAQIQLDLISTMWMREEKILRFFGLTIVADPKDTVESSWVSLKGRLNSLRDIATNGGVQMLLWGVECHRKGRSKREDPVNSTLLGKPHLHVVLGMGSRAGIPVKDRDVRIVFSHLFKDVTVKELKKYKDLCTFLGYTMKEYNMGDITHNLAQVGEDRRFGLIVRSRWGKGIGDFIEVLGQLLDNSIRVEYLPDTKIYAETSSKKMLVVYAVKEHLMAHKMRIDREGGYYKLREGATTFYEKVGDLKNLIHDVSEFYWRDEALLNQKGSIEGLIKESLIREELVVDKTQTSSIELLDCVICLSSRQVIEKHNASQRVSLGYIDRKLGEIEFPREFYDYIEKSKVPKDLYLNGVYHIAQGLRYMGKSLYIHGPGGTGKSMVFRELMGRILGGSALTVLKPNDLTKQFGLEGLVGKKVMVLEEFQATALSSKVRETTLMLLEGSSIAVDRKYDTKASTEEKLCVILISNFSLDYIKHHLNWDNLEPFLRRVQEVGVGRVEGLEEMYPLILDKALEALLYAMYESGGLKSSSGRDLSIGEIFKGGE